MKNGHPDESRFFSYVEGTLSDAEHRELRGHVAVCNDCAEALSSWEQLVDTVRSAPDPAFKQSLWAKLRADMHGSPSASGGTSMDSSPRVRVPRRSQTPRVVLGIAASLFVAAFGLILLLGSRSPVPLRMFGGGETPQHTATIHIRTDDPHAFIAEANNLARLFEGVALEATPGADPVTAAETTIVLSGTVGNVMPFVSRLQAHGTGWEALQLEGERHHRVRLELVLR